MGWFTNSSSSGVEGHKPIFYLLNNQPLVPISKIFQNQKNPPNLGFCQKKKNIRFKEPAVLVTLKALKNLRVFTKEPEVLVTLKALKNLRVFPQRTGATKVSWGVFRTGIMHIENGSDARKIRCPIEYPPHSGGLQGCPVISFWSNRQVGFFWEVLGVHTGYQITWW